MSNPGLILFGAGDGVRGAIDAKAGAVDGIGTNREFMALVGDVDEGTAWSVAKFDSVSGRMPFPPAIVNQLPPINWLAASGRLDSGLHGLVRAEARDEQSAQNLRDVVQGFLAFAKLQGSREPAYKGMLDSVALSADGKSVSLSFDLTPAVLDLLDIVREPRATAGRTSPSAGVLAARVVSQLIFFYGTLMTPFNRPGRRRIDSHLVFKGNGRMTAALFDPRHLPGRRARRR